LSDVWGKLDIILSFVTLKLWQLFALQNNWP